jgi:hypothetical protein
MAQNRSSQFEVSYLWLISVMLTFSFSDANNLDKFNGFEPPAAKELSKFEMT